MPDHTEREREARHCTVLAMQRERVERTMESWDAVFACIDDERAAVRSAVLAEVRAKVANNSYAMTFQTLGQYRSSLLAALTALEATDGR